MMLNPRSYQAKRAREKRFFTISPLARRQLGQAVVKIILLAKSNPYGQLAIAKRDFAATCAVEKHMLPGPTCRRRWHRDLRLLFAAFRFRNVGVPECESWNIWIGGRNAPKAWPKN